MITGYEPNTVVKWNDSGGSLRTGTIKKVFRETQSTAIDGKAIEVKVEGNSPVYLVFSQEGDYFLLDHGDVMKKSTNEHT